MPEAPALGFPAHQLRQQPYHISSTHLSGLAQQVDLSLAVSITNPWERKPCDPELTCFASQWGTPYHASLPCFDGSQHQQISTLRSSPGILNPDWLLSMSAASKLSTIIMNPPTAALDILLPALFSAGAGATFCLLPSSWITASHPSRRSWLHQLQAQGVLRLLQANYPSPQDTWLWLCTFRSPTIAALWMMPWVGMHPLQLFLQQATDAPAPSDPQSTSPMNGLVIV
jgi:hypothetical protein